MVIVAQGGKEREEEKTLTTTVMEWLRQFPILPGSVLKLGDAHGWREPDFEVRVLF